MRPSTPAPADSATLGSGTISDTIPAATLGPLAALLAEIEQAPPLWQMLEHILDAACRMAHADTGIIGCTMRRPT
ncbi:MAG TPA: hypothetical protein VLB69_08160 [Rudaea sp.]|nr:hypothetical protein [Rudaea sp.]